MSQRELGRKKGGHTLNKVVTPQAPTIGLTVSRAEEETNAETERIPEVTHEW